MFIVKCDVLKGNECTIKNFKAERMFHREEGSKVTVYVELLWYAPVGRVIAIDEDLNRGMVGEVEGEHRVCRRPMDSLKDFAYDLTGIDAFMGYSNRFSRETEINAHMRTYPMWLRRKESGRRLAVGDGGIDEPEE